MSTLPDTEKAFDDVRIADNYPDNSNNDPEDQLEDIELNGFQFVRTEFFAHTHEPSFTFYDGKVGVNTACVRKLPEHEYIQILINKETRMMVIRPCDEYDLFSFQWGHTKNGKRFPRQVTARLFFMKVCDLMGWNPQHRYKILGKLCRANGQFIIAFNLRDFSTYERSVTDNGKRKVSRTPVLPAEWKDQFGVPYEEHKKALQINMFDGYALFSLSEKAAGDQADSAETNTPPHPENRQEGGDHVVG